MPDVCGSFDWNCNGVIAQQKTCPTEVVQCGQTCNLIFVSGGTSEIPLFTEACN
jgi:hypothetical protein